MANVLMAVFTGVIAFATIVYVIFTMRLWKETKRSADAAKASADAAKDMAEGAKSAAQLDAALHRPYLGVPVLTRHNDYNAGEWAVRWEVRNFGTLPASDVTIRVEFRRNGHEHGNPVFRGPCEVFPQSSTEGFVLILVDQETHSNLYTGNWSLHAEVRIGYVSPSRSAYSHVAKFVFDRETQNFRPEASATVDKAG